MRALSKLKYQGYYIALATLLLLASYSLIYRQYSVERQELYTLRDNTALQIKAFVDAQMQTAAKQASELTAYVERTGDTGEGVLQEMNVRADTYYSARLRFGWSDAKGILRLGSISGLVNPPIDLTHRAYIQAAMREPHTYHFDFVSHAVYERPILIVAKAAMKEGAYFGAIGSLMDVQTLLENVERIMKDAPITMQLHTAEGEEVSAQRPHETEQVHEVGVYNYLTTSVSLRKSALQALHAIAWRRAMLATILVMVSVLLLRHTIRRLQQRYSHEVVHTLQEVLGVELSSGKEARTVLETTGQLRDLLQMHMDTKTEAEQTKAQLHEALQLIRSFQHEQTRFFSSVHTEVETVVEAIEAYGELIEQQHPTIADIRHYLPEHAARLAESQGEGLDVLWQAKENMRFLSQALHAMCRHLDRDAVHEAERLDVAIMIKALLNEYAELFEQGFIYEGEDELPLSMHEEALYLSVVALIFVVQRNAVGDAPPVWRLAQSASRVTLVVEFAAQTLKPTHSSETTLSPFEVPQSAVHHIKGDVAWFVGRYFARQLGADLGVEVQGAHARIYLKLPSDE